jgi:type II secretory ATPase GspE/PulE/Tfp pilus assembly ATPase PilB-like protein
MPRTLILLLGILLATLGGESAAWGADAPTASPASSLPAASPAGTWPTWLNSKGQSTFTAQGFERGPGGYYNPVKIGLLVVVFFLWIATGDWISRDAQANKQYKIEYRTWNVVFWAPFALMLPLTFVIPWFALSLGLLVLAYVVPLFLYVRMRNGRVPTEEKAFTPEHIRGVLAAQLAPLGIKIKTTPKKAKATVPLVLVAKGGATQNDDQKRMIASRQTTGYETAKQLLYKAITNRSSAVMFDYSADAVLVRYQIDGVWVDGERQPRAVGDPVLVCLKLLCGLKPEERRVRQTGIFTTVDESTNKKLPSKLTSQGTKTGERAIVQFEDAEVRKKRLPDLGLRQKSQEELVALLSEKKGLIVLAAPPGGGMTTLTTACLSAIDRFTRSVMALEEQSAKDIQVENVPVTTYDALEQETPMTKLPGIIRQFPDVLVVPEINDEKTATLLCEEATTEDRLVVTMVRARDACEALARPLASKVPPKRYAVAVKGVIAQRLVRKLCDQCKEAYPPPPQILQRLGVPPDKVQAFYRPPTQPRPEPCSACGGMGYVGQVALFELLLVNDTVRRQLLTDPNPEAVRPVARKTGLKTFEDEGLLLVVKGVTSLQELARVLKDAPAKEAAAT